MVEIGRTNVLKINKILDFGAYLDAGLLGEILLPAKQIPENTLVGDEIEVFLYFDSEDRLIATTHKPFTQVNEFAFLRVQEVNEVGAFLDWGLVKNLLLPFREQKRKAEKGKYYLVFVYIDTQTNRIVASAKVEKRFQKDTEIYTSGQEVDLLIAEKNDFGFNVVINNSHRGIIYDNEIFSSVHSGEKIKGYIKKVRDDGKVDVSLYKHGFTKIDEVETKILDVLKIHKGFLRLNDKSDPEEVYQILGMSKKTFKTAIGTLYKKRLITIEADGIKENRES